MIRIELPEDFGDEIVQALVRIEGQLNTASRGVINEALLAIETRAKGYSPVDTGRLRSSIHAVAVGKGESGYTYSDERGNSYNGALDAARSNEGSDIGIVGTNVEYAAEQEFGNGEDQGHKYITKATLEVQPILINKLRAINI